MCSGTYICNFHLLTKQNIIIYRNIFKYYAVSFRMAKVAITKSTEVPLEDGMEIEGQCYSKLMDTKDRLEGLAAFAAKRVPVYQGA